MPKKFILSFSLFFILIFSLTGILFSSENQTDLSGAPPYGAGEDEVPVFDRYFWLNNWQRPEGPAKVGLQVGHWQNDQLPDELERLRGSTGSTGGGKVEWEVNLDIARRVSALLVKEGIVVDLLPATVPPSYWADVFVAIHADGNPDGRQSGFKIAGPWRDMTGRSGQLVDLLKSSYQQSTGLAWDDNITRNMRGYYAFSWWRNEHAIHPMTTAVIVETGFLTSAADRELLLGSPEFPALGIANGIVDYLKNEDLI